MSSIPNPNYSTERIRACTCARCRPPEARGSRPNPLDYLECARFDAFGPPNVLSFAELAFWSEYDPLCRPWLAEAVGRDLVRDPDIAQFAASVLLGSVAYAPDGPSWAGLAGDRILFPEIVAPGIEGADAIEIVRAMRSFVRFLGRRERLGEDDVLRLVTEIDRWTPRFVDCVVRANEWDRSSSDDRDTVPSPNRRRERAEPRVAPTARVPKARA
jgi:hypothetical protein